MTFWRWKNWHFVWSNRNLFSITVELYFIYIRKCHLIKCTLSSKFSKVCMEFDCLSEYVSIPHLYDNQKSNNICVFCKYYYFTLSKHCATSGARSNLKLIGFALYNQDPLKILKIFALTVHSMRWHLHRNNITRL